MTPETPFTSVETPSGDQHAFINNAEGWGVAFIRRLLPSEVTDSEHKQACLSDHDWQLLINIIDAVPQMIAALERAQEALTPPNNSEEADALKVIQCTFDNIKENL